MIKQILCCALLVGQLFAGERISFNLPEGVDSGSTYADFVSKFPDLEGISKDLMPAAPAAVDPEPAKHPLEIKQLRDGIIRQYVQDCQKEQKVLVWNDCCERLAKEEIKLTPKQVGHIYRYGIKYRNPDRKITKHESNKFNAEFDDWVMGEVKQYGLSWTTIASHQNEYSAEEIRRRYRYLKEKNVRPDFTQQEDQLIIFLVKELGKDWPNITKCLPGHLSSHIKNRYNHIRPKS